MNEVTETQDRMVFLVESASKPGTKYRVDLLSQNGAGECSCRDWETRRGPAIKRGGKPLTNATTCKHVRAATLHFCRGLLKAMAESECRR